ncbi:MAG: translational GTPase TypA [bacterium]|nr:translational GTPase TypA [bacterium]
MKTRNIAIIAHVDHGKTTLVDQLLRKSGAFRDNTEIAERAMDSNDIERERGITILAKATGIDYKDYRINILDTPGHADFGGEVERIMHMVDGVLLVVDAYEGTMPQTRFVLKKALEAKITPILVVNKVDRPNARISEVVDEVLELFIELGADDSQLDFPIVYASALKGTSSLDPDTSTQQDTMDPLFETIIKYIPAPKDDDSHLQMQVALLDYNEYVGRIGIGRITKGHLKVNDMVKCCRADGTFKDFRIQKLFGYYGLKRIEIEEAKYGDIVAIAGLPDIMVGETICNMDVTDPLPLLHIDEPTLQMTFAVNNSPFAGKEGKFLTVRKIEDRLYKETQKDVSLKVKRMGTEESFIVSGRGELHLSILIENMRREGYELQVSKPEIIVKEIDGVKYEPYEEVMIETPEDTVGNVIEALGSRGGIMDTMNNFHNQVRLRYLVPSRGMIGFMTDFLTMTRGYGIINHTFFEYRKMESISVGERKEGVLVASETGKTTAYSLGGLEDRGIMFVEPGVDVYEGMIVGEANKGLDLAVNVVKAKQQTNTRSATKDNTVVLKRPRLITLEYALDYINSDELLEVTPRSIRMRKRILNTVERKKFDAHKLDNEE